ncbi:MAG: Do family serine endopeptidase [Rhizobiales bacterium]|nr:Do family serine endopeptidase [Hyphomicrobiales bacterium]
MTAEVPLKQPRRSLAVRRMLLLATTIVALGAAFVFAPNLGTDVSGPGAQAQNLTEQVDRLSRPVGFADIVEKVKPAVISVRVKRNGPATRSFNGQRMPFPQGSPLERFFREFGMPDNFFRNAPGGPQRRQFVTGQGSGFVISADGYAVTNNHVVADAETVEVVTDNGKTQKAKVIGTDPRTDLALIKLDGDNHPYVKLADTAPRIGDWVIAVGNPFGLGGTVTAGIVSARGRDIGAGPYDDFIQIDAPVNKGNSGGPTFDVDGNVIGVNTAIFSPSGGSVGIAFAIPADTVKSVVTQLREYGAVTRGWIGVKVQPVTADIADSLGLKESTGALVAEPQSDGPAAKAGIEAGDVITEVNGAPIKDGRDLAKKIGAIAPGSAVTLKVVRKGSARTYSLTLGTLPKEQLAKASTRDDGERSATVPRLGLTLAPAKEVAGSGDEGVVVTAVDPDGPAATRGFKTGDVILEAGGKSVSAPSDVSKAIADAHKDGKRSILIRVKSGGATRFVALPVGRA